MEDLRISKLGAAVGKKGVGKTWTTWHLIEKYVKGEPEKGIKPRRALILDVNDEYEWVKAVSINDVPRFSNSPFIEVRRVRAFNERTGQPMTLNEIAACLAFILQFYRRGMLLIEDINVYISDNLPNDLVGAICRNRHTELDIILHYQSIGRLTPKIWQNINWIRFHKNTDSVDRHWRKFEDKYEFLKICELLVNNKYKNGDKRFYAYVDTDESKIRGEFTKEEINSAIDEYLSINQKELITPLIHRLDMHGNPQFSDYESAFLSKRNELLKEYTIF